MNQYFVRGRRFHYILQRLLVTKEHIKSADLSKELFVSQPSISAELGTFALPIIGIQAFDQALQSAAAIATIDGADDPMVLFTSLMLAPELFVPISTIACLYLSLTYDGYPFLIKLFIPKKYRGIDMYMEVPEVSPHSKFIFIITNFVLCLLLPVAAPLIFSFFIGMAVKEAKINRYTELLEEGLSYFATFFLDAILGVLCKAFTILNPTVLVILILGVLALAISAVGGLLGGWVIYWIHKRKGQDRAHTPQPRHLSASLRGRAFKNCTGIPSSFSGV